VLAEVATDFEAAKVAAIRAAELVNMNLRIAGLMSADHKKKLLWGGKKAHVEQVPILAAAGTNRWDTVHFSDKDRMEKFHKLMGVKGEIKEKEAQLPATGTAIFTEENQKALQEDLEKQFTQGLRRRDGRTVGLGL
jgi:exonuclease I